MSTTTELVQDIDDFLAHLEGDLEAGNLEQLDADLAQVQRWAERRLKEMSTVSPEAAFVLATRGGEERRALALRVSAVMEATCEPREILQRFLAGCDQLEALVVELRSRPAHTSGPVRMETKSAPGSVAARLECEPGCVHCSEE